MRQILFEDLLTWINGAISFDSLKSVNGTQCETFLETCRELGLFEGDKIWHDTLIEEAHTQIPSNIRLLFVIICAWGEPKNLRKLWTQHKDEMCEDFVHRYSEETGSQYALQKLLNYSRFMVWIYPCSFNWNSNKCVARWKNYSLNFKIPLIMNTTSTCNIKPNTYAAKH